MNAELPAKYLENVKKEILLGRFGTPEEIANVVIFLASNYSSYIDGEIIKVGGGM